MFAASTEGWLAMPMNASATANRNDTRPSTEAAARRSGTAPKERLDAMFRAHHALIWRTLRRLGSSEDLAADATQQAFLVAAERIDEIRPGAERAFLFRTALFLSRTRHRREKRCDLDENMDLRALPSERDPEARKQYVRQLLDHVLGKLEPDLVTVFTLYELEGLTTAEIADLLELPAGTVASRLRRAREGFKREAERLELRAKGAQR